MKLVSAVGVMKVEISGCTQPAAQAAYTHYVLKQCSKWQSKHVADDTTLLFLGIDDAGE